jgi:hypothetical protein
MGLMIIKLTPRFSGSADDRIAVSVAGDVVSINGVDYDFTPLEVGASIPADAVDPARFFGDIQRDSVGELVMTLWFPHDFEASQDARYPLPVSVTEDGPVNLPDPENEVEPEPEPEPEPEGEDQ